MGLPNERRQEARELATFLEEHNLYIRTFYSVFGIQIGGARWYYCFYLTLRSPKKKKKILPQVLQVKTLHHVIV